VYTSIYNELARQQEADDPDGCKTLFLKKALPRLSICNSASAKKPPGVTHTLKTHSLKKSGYDSSDKKFSIVSHSSPIDGYPSTIASGL
jgi:hypothetical protein